MLSPVYTTGDEFLNVSFNWQPCILLACSVCFFGLLQFSLLSVSVFAKVIIATLLALWRI